MQPRILLLTIALGALLAGCADDMGFGRAKPDRTVLPAPPLPEAISVAAVLELMKTLSQSDPARQAEAFQAAKDAADLAPTTSNRLRFAMALAAPGHAGSDAVAAQRQLSELLARAETLLPMERALALVQLKEVEQRLVLQVENIRLRDEVSRDTRDKLQAANRRLQSEQDDNARLRKELEDLQAKLDAVTHIERSINDRKNGSRQP
jgi:hypothetical protein